MGVRSRRVISVDPEFHDWLKKKSVETGLSITDLTRIAARNNDAADLVIIRENKKRRRVDYELDSQFMRMFK